MKYLVASTLALALVLATSSAFDLRGVEMKPRNIEVPVGENDNRITNGNTASPAQFPYIVGLSLFVDAVSSFWCGGSLISTECVLTAAHCVDGVRIITAYLGATNRNDPEATRVAFHNNVIIHPGWNKRTLKNDIALIKIQKVTLSARIQLVKLPAEATVYPAYDGGYGVVCGWGKMSDSLPIANALQWARVPIIRNDVCELAYPSILEGTNICISTVGGVSTCNGDSGGPLVREASGEQVGLTSFGTSAGCALGYPAVFTRITSYLDWINSNK